MATIPAEHGKQIARRMVAAVDHLRKQLHAVIPEMEEDTLELVMHYYLKNKLAKLDNFMGTASVKHGALLSEHAVAACVVIVLSKKVA